MEAQQSDALVCPGWCAPNDLDKCMDRAVRCRKGQFCKVQKEEGEIWGECKDDHEYNHCMDEKNHHAHEPHCQDNNHHGPGHCITDCCNTNDCLSASFPGLVQANTTPAPTMDNTNMVNNGTTLWERLGKGKCADQLANDGCKTLIQTQNVCQDRLALDICPETCGLCAALGNGTVCQDTVINNGCPDLKANADVCNDALAVFICPTTCNMCNELVNSIITSLIGGTSNATDVPPSLLPPSANPSDFPTFDCSTLDTSNCGLLTGLCSSSFVNVVCPSQCTACNGTNSTSASAPQATSSPTTFVPAPPASTTTSTRGPSSPAPTTAMPGSTTAVPTTPTVAPTTALPTTTSAPTTTPIPTAVPTTPAPTTTVPTTAAPTTAAPITTPLPTTAAPTTAAPSTQAPTTAAPTTTSAPTTPTPTSTVAPSTTTSDCHDQVRLNGMRCEEIPGICDSVLAGRVCPRHCGMC